MAPFILKFKGNKSFVAFHNMNDGEALTKTWKVCTKVAAHLEQGQRLENLSWRLWHLHNIMVETDNAKSKREFKKLSRNMGDKLDREKGKNIEELRAPGYKRTESSDKMRRRAEEIERLRDESHSGGGMRRMQFTFSLDTPALSSSALPKTKITVSAQPGKRTPVFKEPALKVDTTKAGDTKPTAADDKKTDEKPGPANSIPSDQGQTQKESQAPPGTAQISFGTEPTGPPPNESPKSSQAPQSSVRFPGIFSSFDPTALLHPALSVSPSLSYGEDVTTAYTSIVCPNDGMGILRPTIELPLDELLEVDGDSSDTWGDVLAGIEASQGGEDRARDRNGRSEPGKNKPTGNRDEDQKPFDLELEMAKILQAAGIRVSTSTFTPSQQQSYQGPASMYAKQSSGLPQQSQAQIATLNPMALHQATPLATVNNGNMNGTANNGSGRGTPGASALPMSAPAGQKTECSNCGATHTPLWRRGLNDELNCNACGLYCKLHKRPRPKSMRTPHGDNTRNNQNPIRNVDSDVVGAKCFNCHTTATPLWRKDDEGKTVCNACGLYYKLHGTNRPLSMKSDVIRKRSRHEIKRAGFAGTSSETLSTSPGTSTRASPARATSPPSAPEEHRDEGQKTPQFSYDYTSKSAQSDHTSKNSPLNDMLSSVSTRDQTDNTGGSTSYSRYFPGPYHPDYLFQHNTTGSDLHAIKTSDISGYGVDDRGSKRRRLSSSSFESSSTPTDPPSSATSLNSGHTKSPTSSPSFPPYNLPYSAFPYQGFSDGAPSWMGGRIHPPMALPEDAPMEFLHPPMVLPETTSQPSSSLPSYPYLHPPMLPVEEAALAYLHPPMLPQQSSPIVGYTHPPMLPSHWNNDQNTTYNENSTGSNENSNNTEMFDSVMNSLD